MSQNENTQPNQNNIDQYAYVDEMTRDQLLEAISAKSSYDLNDLDFLRRVKSAADRIRESEKDLGKLDTTTEEEEGETDLSLLTNAELSKILTDPNTSDYELRRAAEHIKKFRSPPLSSKEEQ